MPMQEIWQRTGEWPVAFSMDEGFVSGVLHLPPEAEGPVPAVLFCHGFTGHQMENHRLFVTLARRFAAAGIAALRVDFRGSGNSWGEFSFMSIETEVADALAALRFLRADERIDAQRVGVLGISLGGCVAAITSGRAADLKATALLAPVGHPKRVFMAHATPAHLEQVQTGVLDQMGWPIGRGFLETVLTADPISEVTKAAGPVLLVHGSKDPTVPPDESEAYAAALEGAGVAHRHVVVDGADHTFNSIPWTEQVVAECLAWFKEHI